MIKLILNTLRNILKNNLLVLLRYYYWKLFFGNLGENVKFYGNVECLLPNNIFVGRNCSLNANVILNARDTIIIGDRVTISPGVIINTGGLEYWAESRIHFSKKVIIEDGVWLGSNAILLPGVTIGKNSIIGAGAVVTKDIPPNSLAIGVPAQIVKQRTDGERRLACKMKP